MLCWQKPGETDHGWSESFASHHGNLIASVGDARLTKLCYHFGMKNKSTNKMINWKFICQSIPLIKVLSWFEFLDEKWRTADWQQTSSSILLLHCTHHTQFYSSLKIFLLIYENIFVLVSENIWNLWIKSWANWQRQWMNSLTWAECGIKGVYKIWFSESLDKWFRWLKLQEK